MDVTKLPPQSETGDSNGPTPIKAARIAGLHDPHDPNISDHVVAVTQLKEKIAHLQKQLSIKDSQLLTKDKQVRLKFSINFHSIFLLLLTKNVNFSDHRAESQKLHFRN